MARHSHDLLHPRRAGHRSWRCALTIHSSRCHFVARLNSGVRPHGQITSVATSSLCHSRGIRCRGTQRWHCGQSRRALGKAHSRLCGSVLSGSFHLLVRTTSQSHLRAGYIFRWCRRSLDTRRPVQLSRKLWSSPRLPADPCTIRGHRSGWLLRVAVRARSQSAPGRTSAWRLTIRSSRTCFVTPNTWQKKLAMCLAPLRKSA